MVQTGQSPSSLLPGPVGSSGTQIPPSSTFQTQNLSSSITSNHPSADEQMRRDHPWKYEGYQAFAKWMASEDDFFVIRRFDSVNAGVILWMQDQITQKEARLQGLHRHVEDSPSENKWTNNSFRWDEKYFQERDHLMRELSGLTLKYNQIVEAFSQIRARPLAQKRQVKNVRNWLERGAISIDESSFINDSSDLISISSRNPPPLGRWIEAWPKLHELFKARNANDKRINSPATIHSSNRIFTTTTNLIIIFVGLAMLIVPMWWLEYASDSESRLKIITGFLCAFILMMMSATINRPFEVVAATAAYAAVLMVFMQIDGKRTQ